MIINLMITEKPTNAIDKNPTTIVSLTGVLRDECSILNPSITIEVDPTTIINCNYAYIPDFGRYYFVNDINVINNKLVQITCNVDVLYTYKNEILTNAAVIGRQEKMYNLYLSDSAFLAYQNSDITTHKFNYTFSDMSYVLAVAGGLDVVGGDEGD